MFSHRLKDGVDLTLFDQQWRESLDGLRDHEDLKLVANEAAKSLLKVAVGLKEPFEGQPLEHARLDYNQKQRELNERSWEHAPNGFGAIFVRTDLGILIKTFCRNEHIMDAFSQRPEIEDFHFSTYGENPGVYSDEAWEEHQIICRAIDSNMRARWIDNGLSFDFRKDPYISDRLLDGGHLEQVIQEAHWPASSILGDIALPAYFRAVDRQPQDFTEAANMIDLIYSTGAGERFEQMLPTVSIDHLRGTTNLEIDRMGLDELVKELVDKMP